MTEAVVIVDNLTRVEGLGAKLREFLGFAGTITKLTVQYVYLVTLVFLRNLAKMRAKTQFMLSSLFRRVEQPGLLS